MLATIGRGCRPKPPPKSHSAPNYPAKRPAAASVSPITTSALKVALRAASTGPAPISRTFRELTLPCGTETKLPQSRTGGSQCGCGGGPLVAQASIVRFMNPLVAHLLAAMLADAADQLSGTPPSAQISVADRTVSCCGGFAAGGR